MSMNFYFDVHSAAAAAAAPPVAVVVGVARGESNLLFYELLVIFEW